MIDNIDMLGTGWIQTFTGKAIYPLRPDAALIDIDDIAHALALKCRFTGHCKFFYSVAQHSVIVSHLVPTQDAMWGLLHDAAEYILPDISRPIKPMITGFDEVEARVMFAVAEKFGLPWPCPESVKEADRVALVTEARDLMGPAPKPWTVFAHPMELHISPMGPKEAERLFLDRFDELLARIDCV